MLGHEEMPETSFREWRNLNQQQVSEHTGGICGLRALSRRIEFQVVGSRSAEVMERQHCRTSQPRPLMTNKVLDCDIYLAKGGFERRRGVVI